MSVVIVTGSAGLIGSEAAQFYALAGYLVVGIDNDMRRRFFGAGGSTAGNLRRLQSTLGARYRHHDTDIRDREKINRIFARYKGDIVLIIHTAAQPSHDWAARSPFTDFSINAGGTLVLLEAMREYCPEAVFIFTSTNKVYGDRPNSLPLVEKETRWEVDAAHRYYQGIPEEMDVDRCRHSLFGASKLAADVLVQEYGRYFDFKTACFRGGVLSGSRQSGVQLHGFINYLMKCAVTGTPYTVFGYRGKQVRDVIHARDVITAFDAFFTCPRRGGQVYNLGGGRESNVSVLEAIALAGEITGRNLEYRYCEQNRTGDHIWYISDLSRFKRHYPAWKMKYNHIRLIMEEIYAAYSTPGRDGL